jgi:hypothetical protein
VFAIPHGVGSFTEADSGRLSTAEQKEDGSAKCDQPAGNRGVKRPVPTTGSLTGSEINAIEALFQFQGAGADTASTASNETGTHGEKTMHSQKLQ